MDLYETIKNHLKTSSGWCDPIKAIALADLVMANRPAACAEIGVFAGKSALSIAFGLRARATTSPASSGVLYAIDSWSAPDSLVDTSPEDAKWWSNNVNLDAIYEEFIGHLHTTGLGRYVRVLRMASIDAAKLVGPLDLLHIDGCHSEWSSTSDVTLWLPKLRVGGTLVMDDVNWPSTQTAVRFARKFCDEVRVVNSPESVFGIYTRVR